MKRSRELPLLVDLADTGEAPPRSPAYAKALEALINLSDARRELLAADPAATARFEILLVRMLFPSRGAVA